VAVCIGAAGAPEYAAGAGVVVEANAAGAAIAGETVVANGATDAPGAEAPPSPTIDVGTPAAAEPTDAATPSNGCADCNA
jgi:hypothetical protein